MMVNALSQHPMTPLSKCGMIESGKELQTLTGHTDLVWGVAVLHDGKRVISASWDNTLKVWDIENGQILASFSGDSKLLTCTVSPDGATIIAGEASGRVHFLRLAGV